MHFTLSQTKLWHTALLDAEEKPLYKITTSDDRRTTSVLRRKDVSPTLQDQNSTTVTSETASEITLNNSEWYEIARFFWTSLNLSSSLIEIDDSCFTGKSIKRNFIFDSNGHRYKWSLGIVGGGAPVLTDYDDYDHETVIARLHRAQRYPKSTRAHLEVNDEYLCDLDIIISTLVYVEKRRKFMREDDSRTAEFSSYATAAHSIYRI